MTIAFFDFDGTITTKDTLWEIIRFQRGQTALVSGVVRLLPSLLGFKLQRIPAQQMKEKVLTHFFGNMPAAKFAEACNRFCEEALPGFIREQALEAIRQHQQQGHEVVVVTASATHWVAPWCQAMGIKCIGSELEVRHEMITGKLQGINCNGEEKVERIRRVYHLQDYTNIYAYGDSSGDKPMLALAGNYAHFRPFRGTVSYADI
ncbi:HAD superfamily hydrolase (TIGR01490 family) [Chitinophaga dinghuensis]|uniref:HAD superfamily hydrolase (TIGR01490 family) n=1 Tax=Chitinophaga dinghuensis TaxID=1539050 RepID=A0A327VWU0_9BACT|nr:HAD family hydrolase [Chitinophaga dinghuensis]RAJ79304.1 HAD superfamily hydrolase (TIGR01490 family) [Chitinophaga dinghuensis]